MPSSQPVDFNLLARAAASRRFAGGTRIFAAGDDGAELFVVKSGTVDISIGGRVVETIGPNGIFGEMALVDGAARSADATAASDAELVPLGEAQFLFLVGEMPYFALNLMRLMARRLRAANAQAY